MILDNVQPLKALPPILDIVVSLSLPEKSTEVIPVQPQKAPAPMEINDDSKLKSTFMGWLLSRNDAHP